MPVSPLERETQIRMQDKYGKAVYDDYEAANDRRALSHYTPAEDTAQREKVRRICLISYPGRSIAPLETENQNFDGIRGPLIK